MTKKKKKTIIRRSNRISGLPPTFDFETATRGRRSRRLAGEPAEYNPSGIASATNGSQAYTQERRFQLIVSFIIPHDASPLAFIVKASDTVRSLKKRCSDRTGTNLEDIVLMKHDGKILRCLENTTLAGNNINENSTIIINQKMRGGGGARCGDLRRCKIQRPSS